MQPITNLQVDSSLARRVLTKRYSEIRQQLIDGDIVGGEINLQRFLSDPIMRQYWEYALGNKRVPRIWDTVSTIALSETEKTAYVSIKLGYICIGTQFLLKWFQDPFDLLGVIIHERNHVLIDNIWTINTTLTPDIRNMAEDAYINAQVAKIVPTSLPDRFFGQPEYEDHPLLMSSGLTNKVKKMLNTAPFKNKHSDALFSLYAEMYSKKHGIVRVDYQRWLAAYTNWWNELPNIIIKLPSGFVHGDHDEEVEAQLQAMGLMPSPGDGQQDGKDSGDGDAQEDPGYGDPNEEDMGSGGIDPEEVEETEDGKPYKKGGRGVGHYDRLSKIKVKQHSSDVLSLSKSLTDIELQEFHLAETLQVRNQSNLVLIQDFVGKVASDHALDDSWTMQSPMIPSRFVKKDLVLSAADALVNWNHYVYHPTSTIPIYVDVSGSMNMWYQFIVQIYDLLREIVAPVYQFSDFVVRCDDPTSGVLTTSGGTSFDIVARHILKKDYKKVIVLSDGEGYLDKGLLTQLKEAGVEIYYIRTSWGGNRYSSDRDFEPLATELIELTMQDPKGKDAEDE